MPSPSQQALLSEEDIRTRVVATWLADHGFTAENISVEFSFELRLGRNVYRVGEELPHSPTFRPRADVLVRSSDGRNLLIIEVKAPNETLDENAKAQGISYARLLKSGGIAPFVVITNGHETQIYDSITEEAMHDAYIPINHRHAQNRFRVSVDDIALRAEALDTFVSLSSDNLLAFCCAQVSQRMRLLRSDDPFSGKKYIRALYVEREDAKKQLHRLLDEEHRQVVLLIGAPQVGKTNFVCHSVEERLKNGQPCLFYPAVGMQGGLLEEISEDFNWILHDSSAPHQVMSKLTSILQRTAQKLLIFIDGWNEASRSLAQAIDRCSERLTSDLIQIVVSFTNIASRRLLVDATGNPSYIAESALVTKSSVPLLEISPEKLDKKCSVLQIKKYSDEEIGRAYNIYSEIYNTQVPFTHKPIDEPFLLRIGMELYKDKWLPESLDEYSLLESSILLKASRAVDLDEETAALMLSELCEEMLVHGAPINQIIARQKWAIPTKENLPQGLFEAALLAKLYDRNNTFCLDFYFSKERDFIISSWIKRWFEYSEGDFESFLSQVSNQPCHEVEVEALNWFLKQPSNKDFLEIAAKNLNSHSSSIKRAVLASMRANSEYLLSRRSNWIIPVIENGANDSDMTVRAEAAQLVIEFLDYGEDWLFSKLNTDINLESLIINLLQFSEEYSLSLGDTGGIILDVLRRLHIEFGASYTGSNVTDVLEKLMRYHIPIIRMRAARAFGFIEPKLFLEMLTLKIGLYKVGYALAEEYIGGIEIALDSLYETYYGTMCRGLLDYLYDSPDEHAIEYEEMSRICMPIVSFYWKEKCGKDLLKLLNSLAPDGSPFQEEHCKAACREKQEKDGIFQLNLFSD